MPDRPEYKDLVKEAAPEGEPACPECWSKLVPPDNCAECHGNFAMSTFCPKCDDDCGCVASR